MARISHHGQGNPGEQEGGVIQKCFSRHSTAGFHSADTLMPSEPPRHQLLPQDLPRNTSPFLGSCSKPTPSSAHPKSGCYSQCRGCRESLPGAVSTAQAQSNLFPVPDEKTGNCLAQGSALQLILDKIFLFLGFSAPGTGKSRGSVGCRGDTSQIQL